MKPRIKVTSKDYQSWLLGLYWNDEAWNKDVPRYRGTFHHTRQAINEMYLESISNIINKPL